MTGDEQAIRNLISKWIDASAKGDLATILGLMDEQVVFLIPGQPPMQGRSGFAASFEAMRKQKLQIDGKSEMIEIQIIGDWAYCWTKLHVTVTPPTGPRIQRSGNTLSILKKDPTGAWVIFRDANLLGPSTGEEG